LELVTEFIDLEDKTVAAVSEQHRKKIRYSCAECNPKKTRRPVFWLVRKRQFGVSGNRFRRFLFSSFSL
jgi:hypothetical protein